MGQNWIVLRLLTEVEVPFLRGCVEYQLLIQKAFLIFIKCKQNCECLQCSGHQVTHALLKKPQISCLEPTRAEKA